MQEFQKGPSRPVLSEVEGKAAGPLARGAYTEYVSTTKGRERCWRPLRFTQDMLFQHPAQKHNDTNVESRIEEILAGS